MISAPAVLNILYGYVCSRVLDLREHSHESTSQPVTHCEVTIASLLLIVCMLVIREWNTAFCSQTWVMSPHLFACCTETQGLEAL